jgi:hypothetical protein
MLKTVVNPQIVENTEENKSAVPATPEMLHFGRASSTLNGVVLLHENDPEFIKSYLAEVGGSICIELDTGEPNPKRLGDRKGLELLRDLKDINAYKILWIRSDAAGITNELIKEAEDLGAKLMWDKQSLLRYKIDNLSRLEPALTREELFEKVGVPASTMYAHLRHDREMFLTDRTWAHLCHGLGISENERQKISNLDVRGFSPEEHTKLEKEIEEIITKLSGKSHNGSEEPAALLYLSDVHECLLSAHPELAASDQTHLETVIRNTMLRSGVEDARVPLWREIQELAKEIKSIPDADIERGLRHRMIGNMFEEVALLKIQTDSSDFVPQYALTVRRDASGQVIHTTDIIDLVYLPRRNAELFRQAYYDAHIRNDTGKFKLSGKGRIEVGELIVEDPVSEKSILEDIFPIIDAGPMIKLHLVNGKGEHFGELIRTVSETKDPSGFDKGHWRAYQRAGLDGHDVILAIDKDTVAKNLLSKSNDSAADDALEGRALYEAIKESMRHLHPEYPLVAVELKKAGSQNIKEIVQQLRRQRDAILKLRKTDPLNIASQIGRIDVVVLNENFKLKDAIHDLNNEPEGYFFDYVSFDSIDGLKQKGPFALNDALEHRTLEEAVLLKRFFGRINAELSANPTLTTLRAEYESQDVEELFLMRDGKEVTSLSPEVFLPQVDKFLGELAENAQRDALVKAASEALREFSERVHGVPKVTEEWLKSIFEKRFPGASYDQNPRGINALTIYQDHGSVRNPDDRDLLQFSRRFQRQFRALQGAELPEEIYAAVTRIAGRYANDVIYQLERVEGITSFMQTLRDNHAAKLQRYQAWREHEAAFSTNLIAARFSNGAPHRLGNSPYTFDWLRDTPGGLSSCMRAKVRGYEIPTQQNGYTRLSVVAVKDLITYAVKPPEAEKEDNLKRLKAWILEQCPSVEELSPTLMRGMSFREGIKSLAFKMVDELSDSKKKIGESIAIWNEAAIHLRDKHNKLLDRDESKFPSEFNKMFRHPRGSADRDFSRMSEALSSTEWVEKEKTFYGRVLEALGGEVPNDISNPDDIAEVFRKLDFNSFRDIVAVPTEGELKANKILNSMSLSNSGAYVGLGINMLGAIEDKLVFKYLESFIRNSAILATISDDLARDYLNCSLNAVADYPAIFTDLYLERFLAISEIMKDSEFGSSVLNYIQSCRLSDDPSSVKEPGELIRRMVNMSLRNSDNVSISNTSKNPVISEYMKALAAQDFETARKIDCEYMGSTYKSLRKLYAIEAGDCHIAHLRRMQAMEEQRKESEVRSSPEGWKGESDLHQRYHQTVSRLNEIVADEYKENWAKVTPYLDENREVTGNSIRRVYIEAVKTESKKLLQASASAALKIPGRFNNNGSWLDPDKYRGMREHDTVLRALRFLGREAPHWLDLYCVSPEAFYRFCGYRSNGSAHHSTLEKRPRIKKRPEKVERSLSDQQ